MFNLKMRGNQFTKGIRALSTRKIPKGITNTLKSSNETAAFEPFL